MTGDGTKKRIVILKANDGGRLGNHLWNCAGIAAYCLEKGYALENPAFYAYARDFQMDLMRLTGIIPRILSFPSLRRNRLVMKLNLYRKYVGLILHRHHGDIVDSGNRPFYLAPTGNTDDQSDPPVQHSDRANVEALAEEKNDNLKRFETDDRKTIYFTGWLFRNPEGLKKHHSGIIKYIRPKRSIERQVKKLVEDLHSKYRHVVGVHLRRGDYRTFRDETLFVTDAKAKISMLEYLKRTGHEAKDTVFLVCSDETVNIGAFEGLNVTAGPGWAIADMFALAGTDTILGSDSTFGIFSAYYGNIPMVLLSNNPSEADWEALGQSGFSYPKNSTTLHP